MVTNEEKKEIEGIKYLKLNNNMNDVAVVAKIYDKLIEQNVFKTRPGIDYLRELQVFMIENGIDESKIRPIPISDYDEEEEIKKETFAESPKVFEGKNENTSNQIEENKQKNEKDIRYRTPEYVGNLGKVKSRRDAAREIAREEEREVKRVENLRRSLARNKKKFLNSMILNFILAIVIIIMIYIASTSDNPTILNYEEKLQNKYSSWAEDLKEKEKELNKRERAIESKEIDNGTSE